MANAILKNMDRRIRGYWRWNDKKEYRYNYQDTIDALVNNYQRYDFSWYPCEPGLIYSMCNIGGRTPVARDPPSIHRLAARWQHQTETGRLGLGYLGCDQCLRASDLVPPADRNASDGLSFLAAAVEMGDTEVVAALSAYIDQKFGPGVSTAIILGGAAKAIGAIWWSRDCRISIAMARA
ncbi:MAG: hypothetical protein ABW049_13505 [Spongiibacteraceae bacterium]